MKDYTHSTAERMMRYAKVDTTSDPNSSSQPSTLKQLDLSKLLVTELKALGINDASLDEYGYVYATLKSNTSKKVPVICYCSHVDTAPDCSGTNVKPLLHSNWDGNDIILPDDSSVIISKEKHPYLKSKIGDDIITASGLTLLGADDKAGVAVIMDFVQYMMQHPEIKHGDIRILFTPDEEVGRGVDKADMKKLGAEYGYTLDGGECGTLEGENFSADACSVKFYGVSAHPGYAKGKMVNAQKVLAHFISLLPADKLCPEATDGYDGFVHPVSISGGLEEAEVKFIIRDFNTAKLADHVSLLKNLAETTVNKFKGSKFEIKRSEQYRNMKEVLDKHPQVMNYAEEAYKRSGIPCERQNIRGGTDGSRLSFMGMPCPNLFTGEMGIHSKEEYVSVQDMNKAVEVLVNLSLIWEEKA
ncbi:MAG: peptidase T [Bacteroidetes bacterium]|jgi:tripeptide aminopeptidase|nr:peptidase T [Bacteroidota bacterium]